MKDILWVFGYGSLIWHPGFEPVEQVPARLDGWKRRFCLCSLRYRGTFEKHGLVLALDAAPDAYCSGVALGIPRDGQEKVLEDLRKRELFNPAYREIITTLKLQDGREVEALTYVVNREHEQYGQFNAEEQAQIIATAAGERGPNCDYLWNTADHLTELGIADPDLDWLSDRVRSIRSSEAAPA
ncbi:MULTISPECIES: gamma-glutamylcyclotransferase [unclassified Pseudovibrio]|uniref:gamma-glutamylcyclotransferase n=1 Tax=unclassified Pseudovibrio TaxID=2627060 RepID=UPI0007AEAC14|nr:MULTISPECIES: gamma-glutamylcyclotransferase [unclassified Pseudovibrio]KZL01321.1 ChaC-like protein [Pseudovibrio sp. W74]KZL08923.1 ChaC-like protein [Pseudovibrio sp. Ad14]